MNRQDRRLRMRWVLLLGAGAVLFGATPARAQYGMGWGMFGGFNTVPSSTQFLNDRALGAGARGIQSRPSHSPLSGNPNAYFNRVRDNGFVPHYDVRSGLPPAYRGSPRRSPGETLAASEAAGQPRPAAQPAPAPAPEPAPKPQLPLASFFDAAQRLVWPAEAPVAGELQEKRDRSDESSLVVLHETKQQKVASISSITEAREKLLDYGRPALQLIRSEQTPRIADSFHLFLLSLYESLAQAATPAPATDPVP